VRDAILDTTAALVAANGLLSVTMSQIAEATGIGRATLYKYFPDVEAILVAWHERQVTAHLAQLAELRDQAGDLASGSKRCWRPTRSSPTTASPTSTPGPNWSPSCIGGRTSPVHSSRSMTCSRTC
jgi:AcrR family transcriptional regulator